MVKAGKVQSFGANIQSVEVPGLVAQGGEHLACATSQVQDPIYRQATLLLKYRKNEGVSGCEPEMPLFDARELNQAVSGKR